MSLTPEEITAYSTAALAVIGALGVAIAKLVSGAKALAQSWKEVRETLGLSDDKVLHTIVTETRDLARAQSQTLQAHETRITALETGCPVVRAPLASEPDSGTIRLQ